MQSGMAPANPGQARPKSLVELRALASRILAAVASSKDTLEECMNRVLFSESGKTFADFDRAWLYETSSGTLRWRGRCDFIIDTYALKKKPAGEIRRFLEVAVYQLLAQDAPSALVVSETVEAIRKHDGEAPSKFANALLRKVADSREQWRSWRVTEESPFAEQVAGCSLPEWLFKKLRKERGSDWIFAFSESVLDRPQTWYRTAGAEPLLLNEGYQGNEPPGFVQDISNQRLVEEVVEHLKKSGSIPRILDLCSAPGGKALGLAFDGYSVIATDIDEARLDRVRENVARLGLQEKIEIRDYESVQAAKDKYDLIWIDAPCSSTGIIRRHPEIKWNRTWHDVERMALTQESLLLWAREHLASEGVVVYSTCSLLSIENEPEIEGLQSGRGFEWLPQNAPNGDGIRARLYSLKKA